MAGDNSPALRAIIQSRYSRVAFYGKRESIWDAPLSLLGQIYAVETALSESIPIAACFADIGVWTAPATARHRNTTRCVTSPTDRPSSQGKMRDD